jgi:hypothetical protein
VGGLLLHGHLLLPQLSEDAGVTDAAEYVGDMRQLQLGPANSSPEDEPVALVRTAVSHTSFGYDLTAGTPFSSYSWRMLSCSLLLYDALLPHSCMLMA